MVRQIQAVAGDTVTIDHGGPVQTIVVGDPAWFRWLAKSRTFRYDGANGHFTARRESASHGRGGTYWKAYRRTDGRLRRAYLGPTDRVTLDRLVKAAETLANPDPAVREPRRSTSGREVRRSTPAVSAHLRLLGTFVLTDGGGRAIPIVSSRAQSMIALLALHRDERHSRRRLSFLLWPESTEAQARNNLRQLLHQLRSAWPDAHRFLDADATTLALHRDVRLEVDVDAYERAYAVALEADQDPGRMDVREAFERAAGLYRGDLLPASFDEWISPVRERLNSRHQRLLDRLVGWLEQHGDYRAAIEFGQQRLLMDSLDERVYRSLMRLHALDQDHAGALRVYQTCASVLERELGVQPDPDTRLVFERILTRDAGPTEPPEQLSDAATQADSSGSSVDPVPLVGRHAAWAQAMGAWRRATHGEAHLLLIGGEPGIGKSRLAAELIAWTSQLGIKSARTRAYAAEGRLSFAPIADWLRSPAVATVLPRLDRGSLSEISRLLPELLTRRPDLPRPSARLEDWQRQPFFEAIARAFSAADHPLVLLLDDLQWCDPDTLEWLHFLLRSRPTSRLLITGTVRSDEIDRRHPLVGLIADLRDARQVTEIELGPLEPADTSKLASYVAGRRLTPGQVGHIQRETEGNPLYVVETVRAGPVPSDRVGAAAWPEPGRLPARVQAVIAARLAQLPEPARALASVAATVGRDFTLEVVREASGIDDDALVRALEELLRRHVVREQAGGAYDFTHDKIREVAYRELTDVRRRLLHRRVANALERAQATTLDMVAAQVAGHYANAGMFDQAAAFYQRAAEVAQRLGSNGEAIDLLNRGLALLGSVPSSPSRDTRELDLQTALGVSLVATEGYGAPEVGAAYERSRELCDLLGRPPSPPTLRALALVSLAKARIDECQALGERLLTIAELEDDPILRVEAHFVIAVSLLLTGAVIPARAQLEASLADYEPARSATHIALYSQDPAAVCLSRLSLALWILGDPDGASRRRAESLSKAEELGHPFTLGYALIWDAILQIHRGDPERAGIQAEAAIRLSREHRTPFWLSIGTVLHGWAVAEQGDPQAGIDEMRKGIADHKATGSEFIKAFQLGLLADGYGRLGNTERGLAVISEALEIVERTNERWCEAELYRRKGDLLVQASAGEDDHADAAETAYRRAVDIAHGQGAQALEKRAATRLAEVRLQRGRTPSQDQRPRTALTR